MAETEAVLMDWFPLAICAAGWLFMHWWIRRQRRDYTRRGLTVFSIRLREIMVPAWINQVFRNKTLFDFDPPAAPVELVQVSRLRALKNHIAILTDGLVVESSPSIRRWEDGMQEVLRELDGGEPDYRRIW